MVQKRLSPFSFKKYYNITTKCDAIFAVVS
jgi:hypothetical protein